MKDFQSGEVVATQNNKLAKIQGFSGPKVIISVLTTDGLVTETVFLSVIRKATPAEKERWDQNVAT